jgi:DHA2 family lincomycin resistance protein-like MFS transporter
MNADTTLVATPRVEDKTSRTDLAIIFTMLIATFVVILNETIMNVAIPKLMVEFGLNASTAQWLATAFMLVMAILIPTTGFLMQRFSTRTLFLTAMSAFSLGTLVAGMAPIFAVLLAGRVLQASGTAIMLPLLTTTILALIPAHRRGAMMGTVSIVISVAPAIGPTISGLIVESLSWRFMFFFVLPIALVVLVFAARNLKNVGETRSASLDVASVVVSALGFGGLLYGFSSAGEGGGSWTSAYVLVPLILGVVSLGIFVWRQMTLSTPLLDLRAFRYPMFALSVVLTMVMMMALFSAAILLPIYLQNVRQFTPLQTGLLLLPGGVLMGVAAPPIGRMFDRYGPRLLVLTGTLIMTAMIWQFTTLTADTSVVTILMLHITFSAGLAMLFTPIFATGLNQLPRSLHSHGSAIASTLQQVAGAIGTALLVTIMSTRSAAYLQGNSTTMTTEIQRDALTAGLHTSFMVATGIALLAVILSLFIRRSSPPDEGQDETAGLGMSA